MNGMNGLQDALNGTVSQAVIAAMRWSTPWWWVCQGKSRKYFQRGRDLLRLTERCRQ
jgi:hypothetical protein